MVGGERWGIGKRWDMGGERERERERERGRRDVRREVG